MVNYIIGNGMITINLCHYYETSLNQGLSYIVISTRWLMLTYGGQLAAIIKRSILTMLPSKVAGGKKQKKQEQRKKKNDVLEDNQPKALSLYFFTTVSSEKLWWWIWHSLRVRLMFLDRVHQGESLWLAMEDPCLKIISAFGGARHIQSSALRANFKWILHG